jgi:hypothetical protein
LSPSNPSPRWRRIRPEMGRARGFLRLSYHSHCTF